MTEKTSALLDETAYDNMMLVVETVSRKKGNVDGCYIPYYIKTLDKAGVVPSNNLDNQASGLTSTATGTLLLQNSFTLMV